MDYNHNEHYPMNSVKVESAYPDTQYVKMESVYPDTPGVIPSVVTSDGEEEMEDTNVDSGTESCDSKDSGSNRKGERKRPGRKKGQGMVPNKHKTSKTSYQRRCSTLIRLCVTFLCLLDVYY